MTISEDELKAWEQNDFIDPKELIEKLIAEVRRLREQVLNLDDALEEYDCGHDERTNYLIALGKAVEEMPIGYTLEHWNKDEWIVDDAGCLDKEAGRLALKSTPLEALQISKSEVKNAI
jgi:hypothetical protein